MKFGAQAILDRVKEKEAHRARKGVGLRKIYTPFPKYSPGQNEISAPKPPVEYPTTSFITPEVLAEVARETKTYLEDVKLTFQKMCATNKSTGKPWDDIKQQLISWVLTSKSKGWIEEKVSLEEALIRDFGEIL